jgi:putative component of membrane protein insertase Oxa1/YidC/SpoIIIJ protein YidD
VAGLPFVFFIFRFYKLFIHPKKKNKCPFYLTRGSEMSNFHPFFGVIKIV